MPDRKDFLYEQYRLNELTGEERRILEAEPDFEERIAALEDSDREILDRYPADGMAALIRRKAEGSGISPGADSLPDEPGPEASGRHILAFPAVKWITPIAAAAVLALAVLAVLPDRGPGSGDDIRVKGVSVPENLTTPEMVLYRNGTDGVEVLHDGDIAAEHDLLQVGFIGGGAWWGAILSVDGNGVVTRHWPIDGNDSIPLGNTSEFILPYSYELDAAPDFEAFFLVWSDASFEISDAETILSAYTGRKESIVADSVNPTGKTGVTVIHVLKSP